MTSVEPPAAPDWVALREAARAVLDRAYAPYSRFPVAAAALTDDGRVVVGVNVENASYGLGLCAECGLVSALHASGGGRLVAFTCLGPDGELLTPCGRCRQLLFEHGGAGLLVDDAAGARPLGELLPGAFGPDDLGRALPGPEQSALPGQEQSAPPGPERSAPPGRPRTPQPPEAP